MIANPLSNVSGGGDARPGGRVTQADVRKAAEGFEAYFLRQLMAGMRSAPLGEDIFGSQATEQFQEMADAQMANAMARLGQFGIAEMLEKQFSQTPGGASGAEPAKE